MATSLMRQSGTARTLPVRLILVVALFCLAELGTPTAQADGVDDAFLNAVKAKGINFASPQTAIMAGHQVCDELDQGRHKADVANDLAKGGNLDGYHAGYFVGLSVAAYCPRHHHTST
ncbi:DUF732 domain-containing protein [Mycobacterium persicum]|uniref:DUF732 domain-containing protein n=1 Tax=Mycobacterium persicum TaxID=1487726 RepID=A0AB38UPW0_9MYCO|nr:DUF732 domain-containing protein [Mycobacterium persicum]ORB91192.1 hypothetical protein B1T49_20345 [Mycobacterium persicum]ORC03200.1 hypothetical protein B1T48_20085 [Mycobacterium persicum]VAZ82416.1 hypothetical protein LAUMK42_01223 [Mycobacterium persicum]